MVGDEVILSRYVGAKKKHREKVVIDSLVLSGSKYTFSERIILDLFKMRVPEQFEQMEEEIIVKKYLSESRPMYVLTSSDLRINLSFHLHPYNGTDIYSRINAYKDHVKLYHPAYVFYNCQMLDAEVPLAYFDFQSPGFDEDIYTLFFIFDLREHEAFGWFSCAYDESKEWKKVVLDMICTIRTSGTANIDEKR